MLAGRASSTYQPLTVWRIENNQWRERATSRPIAVAGHQFIKSQPSVFIKKTGGKMEIYIYINVYMLDMVDINRK